MKSAGNYDALCGQYPNSFSRGSDTLNGLDKYWEKTFQLFTTEPKDSILLSSSSFYSSCTNPHPNGIGFSLLCISSLICLLGETATYVRSIVFFYHGQLVDIFIFVKRFRFNKCVFNGNSGFQLRVETFFYEKLSIPISFTFKVGVNSNRIISVPPSFRITQSVTSINIESATRFTGV